MKVDAQIIKTEFLLLKKYKKLLAADLFNFYTLTSKKARTDKLYQRDHSTLWLVEPNEKWK